MTEKRKRREEIDTQEKCHVIIEVKIGVNLQAQAKQSQGLPHTETKSKWQNIHLRFQRGTLSAQQLDFGLLTSRTMRE